MNIKKVGVLCAIMLAMTVTTKAQNFDYYQDGYDQPSFIITAPFIIMFLPVFILLPLLTI